MDKEILALYANNNSSGRMAFDFSSDENTSIELYSKNSIYTEKNTVLSIPKVCAYLCVPVCVCVCVCVCVFVCLCD